mmetsp:Transcript_7497/g.13471  ORF Transcript_7497/g.13471 Transcript_7497/m.13471 type:complete len:506 (+) Transcript_7497:68-1585(+)
MLTGSLTLACVAFAVASPPESTPSPPSGFARKEGEERWCDCGTGIDWVEVWPEQAEGEQQAVRLHIANSSHPSIGWASQSMRWLEPTNSIHWRCSGSDKTGSISLKYAELWWSVGVLAQEDSRNGDVELCREKTAKLRLASWESAPYQTSIPFTSWESGYTCVKVPSLLSCSGGTLIAFGEGRWRSCSDFAATDIVSKRSYDGGVTWSALQVVRTEAGDGVQTVVGNVAPVQLPSGRILLPHTRNNTDMWLMYSDDEGKTWSKPRMLPNVTREGWAWIGTGPPSSLRLSTGRIIVPSYHSGYRGNWVNNLVHGHLVLSDDDGETWYLGAEMFGEGDKHSNECQAVELQNGSILINARALSYLGHEARIQCLSTDGGLTVGPTRYVPELYEPLGGCEGSLLSRPLQKDAPKEALFYSGPHSKTLRQSMALFRSDDEGASWQPMLTVDDGPSGYSALQRRTATSLSLIYEQADGLKLIMEPDRFIFRVLDTGHVTDLPQWSTDVVAV